MEDKYIIDINKYNIDQIYYRNKIKCVFDPIREKFIILTQEEVIRQKFIKFLIDKLGVPKYKIDVEVPLSRFKAGTRGRADIVVYGELSPGENTPILVVECKAPHVSLIDDVWLQVDRYDEILGAGIVVVTNGSESYAGQFNVDNLSYDLLKRIPTYNELLAGEGEIVDVFETWHRPDFSELLSDLNIQNFCDYGFIGEDTDKSLYPLIMNLAGFLNDQDMELSPNTFEGYDVIGEGIRFTKFGNAGGGGYDGEYKYLIIKGENKNDLLISFAIFGTAKTVNDPFWGTREGYTSLIVGTNYDGKEHSSLQLNIDKYTTIHNDKFKLWHDGTLTIGGIGSAKRSEVIDYIKSREPSLVNSENIVVLGSFSENIEIRWEQVETRQFFSNLVKYAILRDEYRVIRLKNHRKRKKKREKKKT